MHSTATHSVHTAVPLSMWALHAAHADIPWLHGRAFPRPHARNPQPAMRTCASTLQDMVSLCQCVCVVCAHVSKRT
eukprot:352561-Chlamydomonas_euryale.AAC.14